MSEKIYSWLLKLYPAAFRAEYSAAALQLFRDRHNAEHGLSARCRLWLDLIIDLAISIPREYRRSGTHGEPQPCGHRLSEESIGAMMDDWKTSRLTVMLYFYTAVLLGAGTGWVGGAPHAPLFATHALLAVIGAVQYYRRTSNFKRFWRGYELIVGPDRVQQKYAGAHSVTVLRSDVTGLIDGERGLDIFTGQRRPAITVRSDLSAYEQIREHLAAWMAIIASDCRTHEDRRTGRAGHAIAMESLIIVSYVPAVLVRSPYYFLPLALVSTAWLYAATSRQRREHRWMKGAIIPLVALVPILANGIVLLGTAR